MAFLTVLSADRGVLLAIVSLFCHDIITLAILVKFRYTCWELCKFPPCKNEHPVTIREVVSLELASKLV